MSRFSNAVWGLVVWTLNGIHRGLIWFAGIWAPLRKTLRVLRPAWLASLLVIGVSVALNLPQALDVLVDIAARGLFAPNHLALAAAIVLVAGCGWYFSRVVLSVRYWFTPVYETTPRPAEVMEVPAPSDIPRHPDAETRDLIDPTKLRAWVPRMLGFIPILSLALAFLRKGALAFALLYLGLFAAFGFALKARRKWLDKAGRPLVLQEKLRSGTLRILAIILAISAALLALFIWGSRVTIPQALGPMAIVVYAAASWIAFGSTVLVYITYRYEVPSLTVVALLLAALFGLSNDNHEIRQGAVEPLAWQRPSVEEHLDVWLQHRQKEWRKRYPEGQPYPLYLVAAEGGGIRAAYWTASVLARIEQANPGFACHVFAISGVSGGSLGGSVFAALVAEELKREGYDCDGSQIAPPPPDHVGQLERARRILAKDFLGPALAGLFFPDLMQRFSPFGDQVFSGRLAFPDRAEYLELSWEAAWRDVTSSNRFAENFRRLWSDDPLEVPSLFLNGTWVETGSRNVTSNLRPDSPRFAKLDDALAMLDGRSLPLSTAVHMSARFTYVSPAGTMPGGGRRVVDGGYFENSGSMTASEVLAVIASRPGPLAFEPRVLIISNNTQNPNNFDPSCGTGCEESDQESSGVLREILAPIQTLLKTRGARGFRAEDFLEGSVGSTSFRRFALPPSQRAEVPLGWILSQDSRSFMDCVVDDMAVEHLLPLPVGDKTPATGDGVSANQLPVEAGSPAAPG